jgi:type IV pilus assembly protein PilW
MYDCKLFAMKTKQKNYSKNSLRQQGLSLIELLVAMTITMLVVVAASSVYLVARQGFKSNDDSSRNLENGRFAMDILTRNIRMAGAYTFVISDPLSATTFPAAGAIQPISGTEGGLASPDTLTIAYELQQSENFNAATLTATDCLGQSVTGVGRMVINTFSISADGQLQCRGNGVPIAGVAGATLPLVGPVVDLQVTYGVLANGGEPGVDQDPDFPVIQQLNANAVTDWSTVRSANICIDVASFEASMTNDPTPNTNCRGVAFADDKRIHKIYRTTVNIRNATRGSNLVDPVTTKAFP